MEQTRYLISPRVAIGVGVIASAAVVLAIASRDSSEPRIGDPVKTVDVPADAALPDAPPEGAASPVAPKIEGVKATATVNALGVDLHLDVAIALAHSPDPKHSVSIKASCLLDGEWYAGSSFLHMRKLPAGTNVVQQKLALGSHHAFTSPPSLCLLRFEYTSWSTRPTTRETLRTMCWDGTQVLDKPCAIAAREASVRVSAVRVSTGRLFEVSLDAKLERPLDDWSIEIAADCTLADGTTHHATERVHTRDVHAGRPFTGKTWLFRGAQQMLETPESCTVAVELADRQRLVREPQSAWCWRGGNVASGAC